jgi:hypothetical protein
MDSSTIEILTDMYNDNNRIIQQLINANNQIRNQIVVLSGRQQSYQRNYNSNTYQSRRMLRSPLTNFFDAVPVYPTRTQIESATRQARYGDITRPNNLSCPISLEPFNEDDQVTIIRHCSHIFNTAELNRWFQANCKCPVCRYDIRNYNRMITNGHDVSGNDVSGNDVSGNDVSNNSLVDTNSVSQNTNLIRSLLEFIANPSNSRGVVFDFVYE